MNEWTKLIQYPSEDIRRGALLRVPSTEKNRQNWYRDSIIDLMVFDASSCFDGAVYGLIAVSGHKAGLINTTFPKTSCIPGAIGLQRDWLIENWVSWVYPDGDVLEVWIKDPESITSMPKESRI